MENDKEVVDTDNGTVKVCACYDLVAQQFSAPFMVSTREAAIRSFHQAKPPEGSNKDDFVLVFLGEFVQPHRNRLNKLYEVLT